MKDEMDEKMDNKIDFAVRPLRKKQQELEKAINECGSKISEQTQQMDQFSARREEFECYFFTKLRITNILLYLAS